MDKLREADVDTNMETALETLTDIVMETLEGVTGEPMIHLVVAIPKSPNKNKSLQKIILAGNMPPGLAREVLELSLATMGDNPSESAEEVTEETTEEGVCSHCGKNHEIDLDEDFFKKLESFKPVMSTVLALRETEEGRDYINNFIETCGTPEGKEAIVTAAMEAPDDAMGNLKRKFLMRYMEASMGVPKEDAPPVTTH